MKLFSSIFITLIFFSNLGCQEFSGEERVIFGNEILLSEYFILLENKKIGIVTNHTSLLPNNTHLVDTLVSLGLDIKALFTPEHGFRGNAGDGETIESDIDKRTGIPIHSLYGKNRKPTPDKLHDIDVLLFDIQDIGARFYTYISTLFYVLQSAAESNIPVIILDRPNPLGGKFVDGAVLNPGYKSFIGIAPIPVVHGMTIGELSELFVTENFVQTKEPPNLTVIKMKGWKREYLWRDVQREWIPTSPNIPDFETAMVYPGACLIEGTNISEGRGTQKPFITIGAPFINGKDLIIELRSLKVWGVDLAETEFTPVEMRGKAIAPKYEDELCYGILIKITDENNFNPIDFGMKLLYSLLTLYPDQFEFRSDHFDLLAGGRTLREDLISRKLPSEIIKNWQVELEIFNSLRNRYLIY